MRIEQHRLAIRELPKPPSARFLPLVFIVIAALQPLCGQESELRLSEADAKRAAIEKPAPAYSPTARQLKVAGKVEVLVTINTKGHVEDVKVVSGNPLLTATVVPAVKNWVFKPFEVQGRPARATATLSFDFARL